MPDLQRIADELAIRAVGAAYADACNRLCPEDVAASFAPDGTMGRAGGPVVPAEKLLKNYRNVLGSCAFLFQTLHSAVIVIDGDRAKARWWFAEILRRQGEDDWRMNLGLYDDEMVRLDGGWRFASRRFTLRKSLSLGPQGDGEPPPAYVELLAG